MNVDEDVVSLEIPVDDPAARVQAVPSDGDELVEDVCCAGWPEPSGVR